MSDSYDDYESKIQLAEYAWEITNRIKENKMSREAMKQEPVAWPDDMLERINAAIQRITSGQGCKGCMRVPPDKTDPDLVLDDIRKLIKSSQPASKPWVGLTDEERHNIREWQEIQKELGPVWAPMMLYLYLAIEQALKEKNHG